MMKTQITHAIERTSPKGLGQEFIGTCRLCGTPNLRAGDALKPCPNQRGLSSDDALIEAIAGDADLDTEGDASNIQFVSRYDAIGGPPDPATMGEDQCEGMGFVPISENEDEEPWASLWKEAEAKSRSDDGYHFVRCPSCNGTGKKVPPAPETKTEEPGR